MTGGSACLLFRLVIEFSYNMLAAKSGKTYKLSRPFHGPYRIVTLHDNGADVRPVDRPQDVTIRLPFARLRVCPDEIPDKSYPQKSQMLWCLIMTSQVCGRDDYELESELIGTPSVRVGTCNERMYCCVHCVLLIH